jgi:hypothetical protein
MLKIVFYIFTTKSDFCKLTTFSSLHFVPSFGLAFPSSFVSDKRNKKDVKIRNERKFNFLAVVLVFVSFYLSNFCFYYYTIILLCLQYLLKQKLVFPFLVLKKLLKFHLSRKEGQKKIILFNLFRHSIFEMLTPSLYTDLIKCTQWKLAHDWLIYCLFGLIQKSNTNMSDSKYLWLPHLQLFANKL